MEERELLRKELNELMEGASLLTDDRVYTKQSYLNLLTALGCAKVALAGEETPLSDLENAYDRLTDAVDALVIREDAVKASPKKRDLTPVLVAGAFCGGLLLGRHLMKRKKKK